MSLESAADHELASAFGDVFAPPPPETPPRRPSPDPAVHVPPLDLSAAAAAPSAASSRSAFGTIALPEHLKDKDDEEETKEKNPFAPEAAEESNPFSSSSEDASVTERLQELETQVQNLMNKAETKAPETMAIHDRFGLVEEAVSRLTAAKAEERLAALETKQHRAAPVPPDLTERVAAVEKAAQDRVQELCARVDKLETVLKRVLTEQVEQKSTLDDVDERVAALEEADESQMTEGEEDQFYQTESNDEENKHEDNEEEEEEEENDDDDKGNEEPTYETSVLSSDDDGEDNSFLEVNAEVEREVDELLVSVQHEGLNVGVLRTKLVQLYHARRTTKAQLEKDRAVVLRSYGQDGVAVYDDYVSSMWLDHDEDTDAAVRDISLGLGHIDVAKAELIGASSGAMNRVAVWHEAHVAANTMANRCWRRFGVLFGATAMFFAGMAVAAPGHELDLEQYF